MIDCILFFVTTNEKVNSNNIWNGYGNVGGCMYSILWSIYAENCFKIFAYVFIEYTNHKLCEHFHITSTSTNITIKRVSKWAFDKLIYKRV